MFNAEQDVWLPRNIKCAGVNISVPRIVSDEKVEKFVKSLDIGHVSEIPNYSGVSRTVTGLVFMILDLHLRLSYLMITRIILLFSFPMTVPRKLVTSACQLGLTYSLEFWG